MLKDGKDISLKIEILEFLQENPQLFRNIKHAIDMQVILWEMMAEINEAEEYFNNLNFLCRHADSKLQKLNKKLRLMKKNQFENNYL